MVAQRGKDILLKIEDGGGFMSVAGLRTKRLSFDAATVDVTDADSAGRWRELLAGAGVRRASVAGSGLFKDAASDEMMRAAFFGGGVRAWQIVVPDFGTIEGPFQIAALEYAGEYDGEATFEIALESAGALGFEAAA